MNEHRFVNLGHTAVLLEPGLKERMGFLFCFALFPL